MKKKPFEINIIRLLDRCKSSLNREKGVSRIVEKQYSVYIEDVTSLLLSEKNNIEEKSYKKYERDIRELELILGEKTNQKKKKIKKAVDDYQLKEEIEGEGEGDEEIIISFDSDSKKEESWQSKEKLETLEILKALKFREQSEKLYHVKKLETTLELIEEQHRRLELEGPALEEELVEEERLIEEHVGEKLDDETRQIKNLTGNMKEKAKDIHDALAEDKAVVDEGNENIEKTSMEVNYGRRKLKEHYDYLRGNCWSMCGLTMLFFLIFGICVVAIRILPK